MPLQSGSDRVLAAMGRGYTADALPRTGRRRARGDARRRLTTDLIVGFPGETDDDFAATLELVRAARFDGAFTFVFSPRAGTAAAEHAGPGPRRRAPRQRVEHSSRATQELALARAHSAGSDGRAEVLVEGAEPPTAAAARGRTRQNVTVNFDGAAEPGAIVAVVIEAATSTTLRGRLARG